MEISLVIPAYNEGAIIADTINAALDTLSGSFNNFEIIIVDDGSTDDTRAIVKEHTGSFVKLTAYDENRGKGGAVKAGMLAARGDLIFFTDADLAYGLDIIKTGADLLLYTGADIAIGSRSIAGGYGDYPALRQFASKCFSLVLRTASGMEYDTQCGIKGFRKHAALKIFNALMTDGFSFDFEVMMLARRYGYKIEQFPAKIVSHRPTRLSLTRDSIKMLGEVAEIRRNLRRRERGMTQ